MPVVSDDVAGDCRFMMYVLVVKVITEYICFTSRTCPELLIQLRSNSCLCTSQTAIFINCGTLDIVFHTSSRLVRQPVPLSPTRQSRNKWNCFSFLLLFLRTCRFFRKRETANIIYYNEFEGLLTYFIKGSFSLR